MIAIRTAMPEERDALYELWAEVFEEDLVWLDRFFATRYDPSHILVATVDGVLASALHALPATYIQDNREYPCSYIVGAATDPAYRRQGLMGRLLSAVQKSSTTPVTLFPAVRHFYEANGYITTSSLLSFNLTNQESSSIAALDPLPSWDFFDTLYRTCFAQEGFLVRDAIAWEFLITGYKTLATEGAYAFIKDGVAIEAVASDEQAAGALLALLQEQAVTSVQTLSDSPLARALAPEKGVPTPMGMSTASGMGGVYIAEQY